MEGRTLSIDVSLKSGKNHFQNFFVVAKARIRMLSARRGPFHEEARRVQASFRLESLSLTYISCT